MNMHEKIECGIAIAIAIAIAKEKPAALNSAAINVIGYP